MQGTGRRHSARESIMRPILGSTCATPNCKRADLNREAILCRGLAGATPQTVREMFSAAMAPARPATAVLVASDDEDLDAEYRAKQPKGPFVSPVETLNAHKPRTGLLPGCRVGRSRSCYVQGLLTRLCALQTATQPPRHICHKMSNAGLRMYHVKHTCQRTFGHAAQDVPQVSPG